MMSPELGFALFLTLLWGPTALWLAYRAIRGRRNQRSESFNVASETVTSPTLAPGRPEELAAQGFWVCGACRSLNRREAKRCYSCKATPGSTAQPSPAQQPVGGMVAVMAEAVPVKADMVPVMAEAVPVMATSVARSSVEPARTTPALATRQTDPVPDGLADEPAPVLIAASLAAPAGPPVCPYLGFKSDPSTRCDYPDPRNQCHAASGRGATSFTLPRFIPGKAGTGRPQEITGSHQQSHCLTAAHEACARYPAVQAPATN
jgi:hypothetical protein